MQDAAAECICFWRVSDPYPEFCQWYESPFSDPNVGEDIVFHTAEHYMMWRKAKLMGDDVVAHKVLQTKKPSAVKALGRKVKPWNEELWLANRDDIVERGSYLKFTSSKELTAVLVATGDAVLVEASPLDRIWGVGLGPDDPDARKPSQWKGLNLLGKALMRARHTIVAETS